MLNRKPPVDQRLEKEIDSVLAAMAGFETESEEYADCMKRLETLYSLRPCQPEGVTPDKLLTVAGNLTGILLILAYEKKHVVATKALDIIHKFR